MLEHLRSEPLGDVAHQMYFNNVVHSLLKLLNALMSLLDHLTTCWSSNLVTNPKTIVTDSAAPLSSAEHFSVPQLIILVPGSLSRLNFMPDQPIFPINLIICQLPPGRHQPASKPSLFEKGQFPGSGYNYKHFKLCGGDLKSCDRRVARL